ncbi:MAG: hypothetical protein JSW17_05035 [Candidatus Omnitrophota bacterium]|nr:MAG: hypothetical protein JSW17_05035 [Candidatus Omnitrophota bacterium]
MHRTSENEAMIMDVDNGREGTRKKIVKLIFIIYFFLIFEGALRKWFFPGLSKIIFFIRDPFVLMVYWYAFRSNILLTRKGKFIHPLLTFGMLLSLGLAVLAFLQMAFSQLKPLIILYGWRNYCFYLPLVFIIGDQFRGEDLKRLLRYTLIFSIPIAMLVYKQFYSPPSALINKSVADVVYTDTGRAGGTIVRAVGTFTFFHGHQLFIGSVIAFVLTVWVLPKKERPLGNYLLYAATAAALLIFALDFTRMPIFMAAFTVTAVFYGGFVMRDKKLSIRTMKLVSTLVIAALIVSSLFFAKTHKMKKDRLAYSDTKSRMAGMPKTFYGVLGVPFFGYGLGLSTRATAVMGVEGKNIFRWTGEDEWRRIIVEAGPFFGLIYILYRTMLVIYLLRGAIKATRRSNNPLPLALIGYIGVILLIWYITRIGSVHGYGWLFAGFCMAANRLGERVSEGERSVWG